MIRAPTTGVPRSRALFLDPTRPADRTVPSARDDRPVMEDDLVAWGRVLRIETRGWRTGRTARAVVGFAERPDGSLVVAAGSPSAAWARNLRHDPACRITIADLSFPATAHELEGAEHAAAVRDLILRYGTPAEGLGAGPAFRIERARD